MFMYNVHESKMKCLKSMYVHYSLNECFIRTMESAEAMIVFNKYDELMDLVKKYVC